jgi:acylphosphatase
VRRRVVVHGRVQGVFFRETTRRLAEEAGVRGWVRNTWEGTVEAVFEGRPEAVEHLVAFVNRGPGPARVERVEVFEEDEEGLTEFAVR